MVFGNQYCLEERVFGDASNSPLVRVRISVFGRMYGWDKSVNGNIPNIYRLTLDQQILVAKCYDEISGI